MIIQDLGNNKLYIRYRDSYNNLIDYKETYKPYFWSLEKTEHESFINYDGNKVYKRYYANSSDKKKLINYGVTYEKDVSLENRYLIDMVDTLPDYSPRICHLDIETLMCLDALYAPLPVTAITIYDSYTKIYYTFSWKVDSIINLNQPNWLVNISETEEEMFANFKKVFLSINPDIITGWNVLLFDIQYIVNRLIRLDIDHTWLSPVKTITEKFDEHTKNPILGRIVFDLKMGYEKLHEGDIGLTDLRSVLIDNDAPIRKLDGIDSYEDDFEYFLQYNLVDVEGTVWIDERFNIIQFYLEKQRLVGTKFTDTYYNCDMFDMAFLRKAHKLGIVLPTAHRALEEKYEGATIYKPITGCHQNVVVMDVNSMYPSSNEAANMSFETILENANEVAPEHLIKLGNGVMFRKDIIGFATSLLHDIQDYRDLNKSKMKEYEEGTAEYNKYDNIQRVAKGLKNSIYGAWGYKDFRLYNLKIASSITWLSRQAIAHIRKVVETNYPEAQVVYGHTDSVFIKVPNTSIAEEIKNTINSSWGPFEKKYNLIPNKYKIDVDKIFSSILLAGPNMYAGRLENGKMVIKGFAMKKKSTPPIVKNLQSNVINMVLDQEDPEKIFSFVREIVETIRYGRCPISDITVNMKLRKSLDSYGGNSIHVASARWANEQLGLNICKNGDMVKMVSVVKNATAKRYKVNSNMVVGFTHEDQIKEFKINYEATLTKLIPGKLNLIFRAMHFDLDSVMRENTTKGADRW